MSIFVHRSNDLQNDLRNDTQPTGTRIDGDSLLVGRGTNADLRLDDPTVALEHARIERVGAGYRLTDLGSVTGTYLNGKLVQKDLLADGDTVDVGPYRLRVRGSGPADDLALEVGLLAAPVAAGAAAVPVREVDYLRAYGLRRPFFTKVASPSCSPWHRRRPRLAPAVRVWKRSSRGRPSRPSACGGELPGLPAPGGAAGGELRGVPRPRPSTRRRRPSTPTARPATSSTAARTSCCR